MRNRTIRQIGLLALALLFISFPLVSISYADEKFPHRPMNFYIPFPPGGSVDLSARPLAAAVSKILGQPIICVNKPGASGTLAPTTLKTMKPDGYNLSIGLMTLLYLPAMQDVAFDPFKDFTYIGSTYTALYGIVVRSDSPWKSFKDLIDYAKNNPGKIKYSTSAFGGTFHLAMSEIALKEGIKWEIMPFQGGRLSINALLGSHVQVTCDSAEWVPYVESGDLRLLVTLGVERSKRFPNVPCLKELGYSGHVAPEGIIGPAGMPDEIVSRLGAAFKEALYDSEVQKVLKYLDKEVFYMNSSEYGSWMKESYGRYSELIKKIGLAKKQ